MVNGEEEALLKLFRRAEPRLCSWPYSNPGRWPSNVWLWRAQEQTSARGDWGDRFRCGSSRAMELWKLPWWKGVTCSLHQKLQARELVLLWICKDVFTQTVGFQLLHGSFPAATFANYSWAQGKWGKKGTFKIFPRMTKIICLKTNIRQSCLQWLALLFLGSSQGQKHRAIIHITACDTLKYCLRYHYQLLPCTSMLDMKKYSCAFRHVVQKSVLPQKRCNVIWCSFL